MARSLKYIVGGVLLVAVLFLARVEYLLTNPPSQFAAEIKQNQTFQQAFKNAYEALVNYICDLINWLGSFTDNQIIAFSTAIIAVFTIALVAVSIVQSRFIRQSISLARDEFNATHRPRVAVRRVWTQLIASSPLSIEFTIINTGDAPITKFSWNAQVLYLKGIGELHNMVNYDTHEAGSHTEPIQVGEGTKKILIDRGPLHSSQLHEIVARREFLHVIGYIAYVDSIGTTRRTGFFRCYDPDLHRFRLIYDADYEYEYQD